MIKVNGLHAGYDLVNVLRDVTIEIGNGEIVAVLGSNGVGKTTLNNTHYLDLSNQHRVRFILIMCLSQAVTQSRLSKWG